MMENTINELIAKYREIHSHLMDEYSKGNANNQIMQMYRSRMSSILGFIADLQRLGELASVRPEVVVPSEDKSLLHESYDVEPISHNQFRLFKDLMLKRAHGTGNTDAVKFVEDGFKFIYASLYCGNA